LAFTALSNSTSTVKAKASSSGPKLAVEKSARQAMERLKGTTDYTDRNR
jgi:hypothetical protein